MKQDTSTFVQLFVNHLSIVHWQIVEKHPKYKYFLIDTVLSQNVTSHGDDCMVACPSCGTENKEDARFCVNCGADLRAGGVPAERRVERREKRPRDECFGLPHGGAIFGIFIGAIIILWGLTDLLGLNIEIGTFAIIIIGLLIVAGAIYGLTRRR